MTSGGPPGAGPPPAPRWAFLRTRRWLGVVALGLVVATACVLLGRWQWTRHVARADAAALVTGNYDAAPVPLAELLPPGTGLDPDDEWRAVSVGGRYVDDATVVLRNRPVGGRPAVHVLTPFVVDPDDGGPAVLVVDRGWLAAGSEESDDGVPAAPEGEVDLVVRLRPTEPAGRAGPPGQVYRVDPPAVLRAGDAVDAVGALPVLGAYGVLAVEDPSVEPAPTVLPAPDTSLGSHLSYAFQWWAFAVGALVGVVVLARRERSALDAAGRRPGVGGGFPVGGGGRDRPRRRPTAEDEEDALIAAQLDAAAAERGGTPPATPRR